MRKRSQYKTVNHLRPVTIIGLAIIICAGVVPASSSEKTANLAR